MNKSLEQIRMAHLIESKLQGKKLTVHEELALPLMDSQDFSRLTEDEMSKLQQYTKQFTAYLKGLGEKILQDPKFQELLKKYTPEDLVQRMDLKSKGYLKSAKNYKNYVRYGALLVRDIGIPALLAILLYGSFKSVNLVAQSVEKRYGKIAAIISKILGYPFATILMGSLSAYYLVNRNELRLQINKLTKRFTPPQPDPED